ncbi:hypothetical protein B0T14DRAFT_231776 [Immersiella caudata]|uniref:C2H2-type domain-containing protein n=1 Tax=Immersiella caudata TaxID=314043 RepID=A0AA39WRT5_9PEZI|nr:hypothetical protein B0T14DRAFT_231776 [Immersiella caudata]
MEPGSGARTPQPIEALLQGFILDGTPGSGDDRKPQFLATPATTLVQATRHRKPGDNTYSQHNNGLEPLGVLQHYNRGACRMQGTIDAQRHHNRSPIHRRHRRRIVRPRTVRTKDRTLGLYPFPGTQHEQGSSYWQISNRYPDSGHPQKKGDHFEPSWLMNEFPTPMPLLKGSPWESLVPTATRSRDHGLRTELAAREEPPLSSISGHRTAETHNQTWPGADERSSDYRKKPNDQEEQTDNRVTCAKDKHTKSKRPVSCDGIREESDQWNENGDADDQKPKKKRRLPGNCDDGYSKRYACPFYKQNPQKYRNSTCVGPGWISVSRVKEHIYRRHGPPPFECRRCLEPLSTESALHQHIHQETRCISRSLEDHLEGPGISKSQMEKLKKRGKKTATEPDRWREVYRIIFPTANEHEIPSPYYDLKEDKFAPRDSLDSERFKEFLAEEVPKQIGEEIARQLPMEPQHVDTLTSIVRRVFKDAFDSYMTGRAEMQRPLGSGISQSVSTTTSPEVLEPSSSTDLNRSYRCPDVHAFPDLIWEHENWRQSEGPSPSDSGMTSDPSIDTIAPLGSYDCTTAAEETDIVPGNPLPTSSIPLAYFVDPGPWLSPLSAVSRPISFSSMLDASSTLEIHDQPPESVGNETST